MDGEDLELFERSLRHATETLTGRDLDDALSELGWADALAVDPRAAVSVLFELQGRSASTSSALDDVVGLAIGLDGHRALVLPPPGRWDPPGRLADGSLTVRGSRVGGPPPGDGLVVPVGDGQRLLALDIATERLTVHPVDGIDPWFGFVAVSGDTIRVDPGGHDDAGPWADAVRLARLAVGHELIGTSRRMLELARQHALERVQFDRPISSFQAVRHRLADTLIAIETADGLLGAAWEDHSPETAAMAKALAGRSARMAARHCQQVLAGIGFTMDHPLHRHVRRVFVLDEMFGASRTLTADLGAEIVERRELPEQLPL